jgi:sugar transferase (PEP-CTERM system associated)
MNPKVIGSYEQLLEIVAREGIDKIVVAMSDRRGKLPVQALLTCKLQGINVEDGATFYERLSGKILLENLRPSWMIFSSSFTVSPLLRLLKRLVDIVLSGVGLVFAAPLLPVIAMLIKLDSRGPVFFVQERVGQNGKPFILLKFRSMLEDAEAATGPIYADQDDYRVTRVGRLLRTSRLDELPQLLNVLRGEMSFVGPRPERPFFVEQFEKQILYYTQRLSVKPGITGWAQVCYPYGATLEDAKEKLRLDLYYVKNMSLMFDLFIILYTVRIVIFGQGSR